MAFAWRRRVPRAKLPPVERATRKVYRWKWVQTGALVLNLVIMAALAGLMTSRDISVAGGVVVPIIMVSRSVTRSTFRWLKLHTQGWCRLYRHRASELAGALCQWIPTTVVHLHGDLRRHCLHRDANCCAHRLDGGKASSPLHRTDIHLL